MTKSQALELLRECGADLKAAVLNAEDNRGEEPVRELVKAGHEATNAIDIVLTRFAEFEEKEERVAA
jgi:hypothetical protein